MLKIINYKLYENDNSRRLFALKGKDFDSSETKIIFIVHDAQNFFEKEYSLSQYSWEIKEALKSLNIDNYLVAGLECKEWVERFREYSPVPLRDALAKEYKITKNEIYGNIYIDQLKDKLIPFLEKEYNFTFDKSKKYLIGSSMGGVITTYAAFKYPNLFDGYVALSNALFANYPYIHNFIEKYNDVGNYFHSMGGDEHSDLISNTKEYIEAYDFLNKKLLNVKNKKTKNVFIPNGRHSEKDWSEILPTALKWVITL